MNKLPLKTRSLILRMLCEGTSLRATARLADVSLNTVKKILVDAGTVAADLHHERVRDVRASRIQCDEIWSFTYCRDRTVKKAKAAPKEAGDTWTWTAIDSDSKLMVSWLVGDRSGGTALELMDDVRARLANRVQLTTDGLKAYLEAVEGAFGGDVDYAMLVKIYGESADGRRHDRKYSPAQCRGARKVVIEGNPDRKAISTSHVERHNLSMRMHMRRFTRLTNAFSKKVENHVHMVALYTFWYNFMRVHGSLRVTPAMEAGLTDTVMDMEDFIAIMDDRAPKPKPRGPNRKRNSN